MIKFLNQLFFQKKKKEKENLNMKKERLEIKLSNFYSCHCSFSGTRSSTKCNNCTRRKSKTKVFKNSMLWSSWVMETYIFKFNFSFLLNEIFEFINLLFFSRKKKKKKNQNLEFHPK